MTPQRINKEYFNSKAYYSLVTFVFKMFERNPGGVFECRVFGANGSKYLGYFDNAESLIRAILPPPESPREKIPFGDFPRISEGNHYLTMNPVKRDLFARSANKFMFAKTGDGTSNEDAAAFNMFFIDLDPKRLSGISASDSERREARKIWIKIRRDLRKRRIKTIPASSGNGYHIVILTSTYTGDDIVRAAERGKKILEYLKMKYENDKVEVDVSVCAPAHLIKLYGSLAMKGSSIPERPHRYSTIDIPDVLPPDADIFSIYKDEIEAWDKEISQPAAANAAAVISDNKYDALDLEVHKSVEQLEDFLKFKELEYRKIEKPDMVVLAFKKCPSHKDDDGHEFECCLTVRKSRVKPDGTVEKGGAFGASCMHDGTAGWKQFKEKLKWKKYVASLDREDYWLSALQITDNYLASLGPHRFIYLHGVFYQWNGHRYEERLPVVLDGLIMQYLQSDSQIVFQRQTKASCVRDVIANMKGRSRIPDIGVNSFISGSHPPGNYIAVANGILCLDKAIIDPNSGALLPATSNFYTLVSLPYAYDPAAKCPLWMKFLDEVQSIDEVQYFLQEWFGYCLTTGYCYETFVILVGPGANGKSVILKVQRAQLGPENVSTVPIELFEKPFNRYELYGKLANIVSEMSECEKVAEEIIKAVVSGDPIQFERKHVDPFSAPATAKLIFATNVLPPIRDRSNALWRRLVLIPFNVTIALEQQDKGLADRLIASELPGILNWAIVGLKRLKERGYFIKPSVCSAEAEQYQLESSSVRRFIAEECKQDQAGQIGTQSFYGYYKSFCERTGSKTLGDVQFGKELRRVCPKVVKTWSREKNGYVYVGVRSLTSEEIEKMAEKLINRGVATGTTGNF
jgi:P4 family phage/plasmid primase-like protien